MKIGLTYSVRKADAPQGTSRWDDDQEEFDSPETVQAIAGALARLGHDVELLGDGEELLRRLLDGPRPELVFNFAEGRGVGRSREAHVPAMLEMLGIPYTGSDPLTLAVTLDKDCAKRLVAAAGVPTPKWFVLGDAATADLTSEQIRDRLSTLRMPAIVKPAFEGSSKGVLEANVFHDHEALLAAVTELHENYRQPILIEEYIEGDELTVGVLGNAPPQVAGIMRVLPTDTSVPFVYSLEVKRDWKRRVRYECPAKLADADTQAVERIALAAWHALGCRDLARIDFRLRDGVPYFLEANPLPGLAPTSGDLVLLCRAMGIEHDELIERILRAAQSRLAMNESVAVG